MPFGRTHTIYLKKNIFRVTDVTVGTDFPHFNVVSAETTTVTDNSHNENTKKPEPKTENPKHKTKKNKALNPKPSHKNPNSEPETLNLW